MPLFFQIFIILILFTLDALAFPKSSKKFSSDETQEKTILKADEISGDQNTNILNASGNVEINRGTATIYSDQVDYEKDNKLIKASGNIKIRDLEYGKIKAAKAEVKDDFTSGEFLDSTMVFNDGSYLISSKATRKSPTITVLKDPIYSLCPNPKIEKNSDLAGHLFDMVSIKSKETTINRETNSLKIKHGVFRLYKIPFFYSPYLSLPLPSSEKRKTGFLTPSYVKNTRFGLGFKTPYFIDIGPNMDLTVTPQIYTSNSQLIVSNDFRHLSTYGLYNINLEMGNNKVTSTNDTTVINRTKDAIRWMASGEGKFEFNENSSINYKVQNIGDRNYLRDYYFNFLAYTASEANYDYVKGRDYFGVKTVRFQELQADKNVNQAQFVLPTMTSYIESRPGRLKEKYALTSNITAIQRQDGLQYKRVSMIPEAQLPFNLKGNLIDFNTKIQADAYSLDTENSYDASGNCMDCANNYKNTVGGYKPEFSINWRLPLVNKGRSNTIVIEPMANFVTSSFSKNYTSLPLEDSNNTELTVNNLFVSDRIAGYDRNEAGQRSNFGVKSTLFNKYGQFGLTVGQSYRLKEKIQDVAIRGFNNNNKSNFVGELFYKFPNRLSIIYSFQLNESSYRNDVNEVLTSLTLDRFTFSNTYLLLRKTNQNLTEISQTTGSASFKINEKLTVGGSITKDLANQRIIARSVALDYRGCCTIFTFTASENNASNLIKPQKSYKFNITFINL